MNPIQNNNIASADLLAAMNPAKDAGKTADATQDRFMKLLVTQMKNQDPLNPLDNAQVTSQLAQLSTVSGIDKMNATLQSLMGSFQSNQAVQAAGMIGHGVLVPGNKIDLASGKAVFGLDLASTADRVQVAVKDASGKVVHTMDLGGKNAGTMSLAWDGVKDDGSKAVDGPYTIEATATFGQAKIDATALAFGQVASVSTGKQGVSLNVPGLGAVSMSDVRQIL
jgi:flagellar basal-body rod modification protein FlgD